MFIIFCTNLVKFKLFDSSRSKSCILFGTKGVGGNGSMELRAVALIQFSTRINPGRDTDHDTAGSCKCRIN